MPSSPSSSTLFEDAIDVPLWLTADSSTPFSERVQRDRSIARRITATDASLRVRAWWRQMAHGVSDTGARLQQVRRMVNIAMGLLGAGCGTAVALAAFHYTGTVPVNVVTLVAVLVVAPLLLVLPGLLLLAGRVPGFRTLSTMLAAMNPGVLAAGVCRRLAQLPSETAQLFTWQAGRTSAAGRYARWQVLVWSQTAAVTFNLATIATGICLISFTDLAFGWSTTLAVEPRTIHRFVTALALPWRDSLPGAVPDLDLIEQSQFFRLAGAAPLGTQASRVLAGWWSFVVLAIISYGLIPRVVLLVLGQWRLHAATRALLIEHPQVTALCDRMDSPMIETAAHDLEHSQLLSGVPPVTHAPSVTGEARAVIWGSSIDRDTAAAYARSHLGLAIAGIVEAGGDRPFAADTAALEQTCANGTPAVIVFTRAWEPPLLELLDYLAALRDRLGPATSIVVAPVPEAATTVTEGERITWARAIDHLADPRMYVETGTP